MDELSRYNRQRWDALAEAGVAYSRPWLDLDADAARAKVDPEGVLGDPAGMDVLCLAGGGGQQSAAFALLGANVTVLDFSRVQLQRDREAAGHYGKAVRTLAGDMRDLSALADASFDVVWHAHSLGFVPRASEVYDGVARVLRPGGLYRLSCWNPLIQGADERWTGEGYMLAGPYEEGAPADMPDPHWDIHPPGGEPVRVAGPREFRHPLTAVTCGLTDRGFVLLHVSEHSDDADPSARPGTWGHFSAFVPTWLVVWARLDSPQPQPPDGVPRP